MSQKQNKLTQTGIVALLACVCCILWGSVIPVIKTGYHFLQVDSSDTASQIVFAGIRFTLAGILVLIFASIREKKVMLPDTPQICHSCVSCPDSGAILLFLHRSCTHFRSKRWNHHRAWKFYCNLVVLSGISK